jgi:hypothetical protein
MKFVAGLLEDLLKQSFSCRDIASKKKIIEIGRPTPFLTKMVKQSNRLRHFSYSWYKNELQDLENIPNFGDSVINTSAEKIVA